MTFDVRAQLLLDNSNWERKLTQASRQTASFGKSMKTISNGVKAAWAGVAVVAFGAVGNAIMDVTKAAAEDKKSTDLLNKSLDNSWKATDKTKKQVDDYIQSMSNLTGIVDDNLRPAYSTLARQTHSVTKANKMLSLALNIAADKHMGVDKAAKLVAKAMAGNQKAFDKFYPSASKTGNALQYVTDKTIGLAEAGAGPFEKINAIMDNFKEKLGTAFLPVFEKFAAYLASPEAQKGLDEIASKVQKFGEWFASPKGQKAFKGWMEDLKALLTLAGQFLDMVGEVAQLLDTKTNQKAVLSNKNDRMALNPFRGGLGYTSMNQQLASGTPNLNAPEIHIYVDPIDGKISRMLKKEARSKGITVGKMLM